jgi:hypothetical protein
MQRDVQKREQSWGLVIAVLAALALLVFLGWRLLNREEPTEATPELPPAEEVFEPAPPEEPLYPIEEPEPEPEPVRPEPERESPPEPVLPTLDDSDEPFTGDLDALTPEPGISGPELREGLIRKIVATVDGLARDDLAERVRPVDAVPDSFKVSGQVDGDLYILSPANYERYDAIVSAAADVDLSRAAALYRRYYPLFQQAYAELGYPDRYFNDRLVAVIDRLLATPDVADPIRLVRPHVLYRFENPVLESLSSGQKLLIRMGPENRTTVKKLLRQLRAEITGEAPEAAGAEGGTAGGDS